MRTASEGNNTVCVKIVFCTREVLQWLRSLLPEPAVPGQASHTDRPAPASSVAAHDRFREACGASPMLIPEPRVSSTPAPPLPRQEGAGKGGSGADARDTRGGGGSLAGKVKLAASLSTI